MRTHRLALALAVAVVLAGCQSMRTGGTDEPVPDTPGAPTVPAEQDAPLLQIDVSGGFVMMGYDFATVPALTVYADGRAIAHGPQILIYPGPALPNLLERQLSQADLETLVGAAFEAGLLGEVPDYGQPPIADAPSTFVTITIDGQTYRHVANALDAAGGGLSAAELGLTDDQLAARNTLAEFVADAQELVGADGEPYEITAFGIVAWSIVYDAETTVEPDPAPEVLRWPLDLPLADAADCTLVEGADAATLLDTLTRANQITQFEQGGAIYEVHVRPLLPHETGCADLE